MVASRFLPFLLFLLTLAVPLPSARDVSAGIARVPDSGGDDAYSSPHSTVNERMEYELEKRRRTQHHHHHGQDDHGHHDHDHHRRRRRRRRRHRHQHHRRHHRHHSRGIKGSHKRVPGVASTMPMPVDLLKDQALEKMYERHAAKEFLDGHNSLRDYFGEPRFTWNKTLFRYARDYLKQKKVTCGKEHSGGPYGENLFWGTGNRWRAVDAVQKWAMEHYYYNDANNSCLAGRMCGHYTQMVWKSSLMIGCARMVCRRGDVLVLCSYDPPGNYVGERPFQPA